MHASVRSTWTTLGLLAAVTLGYVASAAAQVEHDFDENAHLWQPKTRSVAVFKNGLGFFTQQESVSLHERGTGNDAGHRRQPSIQ